VKVTHADKNIFCLWIQSEELKNCISDINRVVIASEFLGILAIIRCMRIALGKQRVLDVTMKFLLIIFVTTILVLTACSPEKGIDAAVAPNSQTDEAGPDAPAVETVEGVTTVRIDGNDRMQFTLTEFTVKSGDTVRIIFNNTGQMPVTAMGHNVVVLKKGVDSNAYAGKAALARDTGFIPASEADSVIAHTKLLGPDQSDTIEFIAPEPGNYDYLCSFPAHCFAGMRGVMTVTD